MIACRIAAVLLVPTLVTACRSPAPDLQAQYFAVQANEALQARAYHEALSLTDSALALHQHQADAQFIRGRVFFELGQMAESQTSYETLLKWAPDYPGAHHNLGNAYFGQKQYHAALAHFRREAAVRPAPSSWHALGATYEQMALSDSAIAAYLNAVSVDADYAPGHESLAKLYEREALFTDALEHAVRALALQPSRAQSHYLVGLVLFRLKRFDEATSYLNHAAESHPWDYSPLYTLGQALQRMVRADEAQDVLAKSNALRAAEQQIARHGTNAREQPTNFQHQIQYADALRSAGRLSEAISAYLIALALRPHDLELQNNIATAFMQQGDTTEALSRYRRILGQDSTFAVTWVNLGWHYARANRMRQAVQAWATAARHDPDHPAILALKATLQHAGTAQSNPEP